MEAFGTWKQSPLEWFDVFLAGIMRIQYVFSLHINGVKKIKQGNRKEDARECAGQERPP